MKARLEGRLRTVTLRQKWHDKGEAWIWALEMTDDVQEGLPQTKEKPKKHHRGNRTKQQRNRGGHHGGLLHGNG